jgi:hypothetical protein
VSIPCRSKCCSVRRSLAERVFEFTGVQDDLHVNGGGPAAELGRAGWLR